METSSCGSAQLERLNNRVAVAMRVMMPNHFAFMKTPGTEGPKLNARSWGLGQIYSMVREKSISKRGPGVPAVGKKPVELLSDRDCRGGCRHMRLGFYGFGDHGGQVPDVFFGGVEGAHPADDAFVLNPHVEEVAGFDFFDGVAGDLDEYAIGLHFPDDFHSGDKADLFFQQASHAIGVFGAAAPEVVREQSFELHGDEAHF